MELLIYFLCDSCSESQVKGSQIYTKWKFMDLQKANCLAFVENRTAEYVATERSNNEPCPAVLNTIRVVAKNFI